jgi:hypothetical protein
MPRLYWWPVADLVLVVSWPSSLLREKYIKSQQLSIPNLLQNSFFCIFFGGLECLGPSFAYVAHFVFLRDVWILTQRAAVASRRATDLATPLPSLATHLPVLATHLPNLATHLPRAKKYFLSATLFSFFFFRWDIQLHIAIVGTHSETCKNRKKPITGKHFGKSFVIMFYFECRHQIIWLNL